jgi:hypothetical protein
MPKMTTKSLSRTVARAAMVGIGLLAATLTAKAAIYYVDANAGSDRNAGTSPSTPWQNCPGMKAYVGPGFLRPGDTVYFNRGATWRLAAGTQGLYLVGGVTYVGNVWGSGTDKAHLIATTNLDYGLVRFRDNPTYPTVFQGFNVNANGTVTTGVDINHAQWTLMNGALKRVQDCEVQHVWSLETLNQYKYGIIVSNHGGLNGYAENVEIIHCLVHDISRTGIALYPGDENANCRIKNMTVRGCEVYNTGQDPDFDGGSGIMAKGYVQDAVIEYNYVHDTKGPLLFLCSNQTNHFGVGLVNIHLRYNLLHSSTNQGSIRLYSTTSGSDPKDAKIYGNLAFNSSSGFYLGPDVGNTVSLLVYNNTFYNAKVLIDNSRAKFTVFEFKNNLMSHNGVVTLTDNYGRIVVHSNNLFYRSDGGTLVHSNGLNYSASNLIQSYEPSALVSNPLFKNVANLPSGFAGSYGTNLAPNNDGLSLRLGSPGINTGVTLSSTFDNSINSIVRPAGGGWDLGAYEQ